MLAVDTEMVEELALVNVASDNWKPKTEAPMTTSMARAIRSLPCFIVTVMRSPKADAAATQFRRSCRS